MTSILTLIFGILLYLPAALWNGLALSILWGWFIVPVFSLPALSVASAAGVSLFFHALSARVRHLDHEPDLAHSIALILVGPQC